MAGEGSSKPPIASIEAPHMVSYVKLPILKKDGAGNEIEVPPVTAQQILARRRERKAKSTLVMAIPDEHLARFHGIKDSKTLWDAIKTRFGDNVESKKMQKNVLKQQFEIYYISNPEGLDKGYDIFQRLLSVLEILKACVSTKDANQKFLRSLPSAWSNISLIMRNKPCIDTLDIDDLYNNLKVYEAHIKGSFGSSSNSQNAQGFSSYADELMFLFLANQSSIPQLDKEDLEQIDQDNLEEIDLKWQVTMISMRVKQFYKKTRRNLEFNGKEPISFDKKMLSVLIVIEEVTLPGIADQPKIQDTGVEMLGMQDTEEEIMVKGMQKRKMHKHWLSRIDLLDEALKEKEDLKAKLEKLETSSKNLTKLFDSQISAKVKTGLGYDRQFNEKEVLDIKDKEVTDTVLDNRSSDEENSVPNDRFKKGEGYHAVPPPLTRNYMPPKLDMSFAGLDDSIYKFKLNWETDSDDDSVFTSEPIPAKTNFVKAATTRSRRNSTERVNTDGSKAVSAVKGNGVAVVKTSAAGSKSRPPMLNKENYVSWSSRLLQYAKSRPNRKLIHNSILNEPYVRRMIPELGNLVRVQQMMKGSDIGIQEKKAKLFNEWERFTSNEGESIESYYHHFLKLINDLKRNKHFPKKIASNLKFLNNLQPE
nr:ribonuclease H-like domain-containing protein [Tanacetum cinerariifolium]